MLEAQAEWTIRTPGGPVLLNGEQTNGNTAITAMSPIARYKFEDTSTTMDDAVGANDGTYVNTPTQQLGGVLGGNPGARRFNGSTMYASIPYAAALDAATWSWHMWVYAENTLAAGANQKTILRDASQTHVRLYYASENLYLEIPGSSVTLDGGSFVEDTWYEIAIATDGWLVYLYRDGELVDQATLATAISPRGSGAWEVARGSTAAKHGEIRVDDLAYFNSVLTLADITRLHAVTTDAQDAYLRMTESPDVDVPARTTVDSYPLADGGVVGDQYADPARWNIIGILEATTAAALQGDAQRWRGRLHSLMRGAGLLMWEASGFPPLQTTIRRGEKPDAGRGTGSTKPLMADFIAADPRVYTQAVTATHVTVQASGGGVVAPLTEPLVESPPDPADAATITNSGDAFTPPEIVLTGPFSDATITRTHTENGITTVQQILVDGFLDDGDTLTLDVATGRVYTGTAYTAASRAGDMLNDASVLWRLGPGENTITCQMTGIGSASSCIIKHRSAWMP